ncbi:MAG: carbohydrate kinase family protein [Clostridia bacterium]|nr:carbohydrate kinase family protein [Clostridia bacterium]
MREGIAYAGNLIVDRIRRIDRLPRRSELAAIHGTGRSTGGACNGAISMKLLAPELPVAVYGAAGMDAEGDFILSQFERYGVETKGILRRGETAFTDVYEESSTHCRTFFYFGGANDTLDVDDIDYDSLSCRILQVCYPLLLRTLDMPDDRYGSRMGILLHRAQQAGCLTALDVISEDSDRYKTLVRPLLAYTDYLTVNEIEAERITGVPLTGEDGRLLEENVPTALSRMLTLGVSRRAIIHAPAAAFGMDANGTYYREKGKHLPDGFIKGTVGAGDAFCAGALLAAYRGLPVWDALRWGNAAAVQSLRADTSNGSVVPIEECLTNYDALSSEG